MFCENFIRIPAILWHTNAFEKYVERHSSGYNSASHVLVECTGSSFSLTLLIVSCLMTILRIGLRAKVSSFSIIRFDFMMKSNLNGAFFL